MPVNRRRPLGRGALTLVAATSVLLGGCAGGGFALTAPPMPESLPVPEYQALLTGVEQTVQPMVDRIGAATTIDEIIAARAELARSAEQQRGVLGPALPPPGVRAAHDAVVDYLRVAATVDTPLPTPQTTQCGLPPSQEQQVYEAKTATQQVLSRAALALHPADFTGAGLSLTARLNFDPPQAPAEQNRRADNGEVVQRSGSRGSRLLHIHNDGGSDAVIAVVAGDPADPRASIYVQASSEATLTGVRGDYEVYFKTGTNWDGEVRQFTRGCRFQKFDSPFDGGSNWEIWITPTLSGNAPTSTVEPF